jgi:hypothetical protein
MDVIAVKRRNGFLNLSRTSGSAMAWNFPRRIGWVFLVSLQISFMERAIPEI